MNPLIPSLDLLRPEYSFTIPLVNMFTIFNMVPNHSKVKG